MIFRGKKPPNFFGIVLKKLQKSKQVNELTSKPVYKLISEFLLKTLKFTSKFRYFS